jgi:peptidoglycan/LPS O-acetylase OafA/YrhL
VHPLVRFIDFYWGMLLARCYDRWQSQPRTEMLLLVLLLAALALYPIVDAKVRNAPLFWIVLLPLIGVFAQQRGWLSRLLQTRTMLWLGSLTMPLFLTHQMMIPIVQHHLPDMPAVAMLAACLLVALTVSWGIQTIFSRLLRL